MKTMKYYYDLYLICNILLLVAVLEKFRKNSLKLCIISKSLFERISFKLGCNMIILELEIF